MRRSLRCWLLWGALVVAVIVAHALLQRSLAGSPAAAVLLAPNPKVPVGPLLLVGTFVLLRLFLILVLPGLLLAKVAVATGRWAWNRRRNLGTTSPPRSN